MRTPQMKLAALLLLWAAVLVFQLAWVSEFWRLPAAEASVQEQQIERGAQLYAANCVVCHGPAGEGVVGPPVNRPEWREDLTAIESEQVRAMLTNVIGLGRGGTDTPVWEFSGSGNDLTITSYTNMPAWSRDHGGPMNEQQVEDLVVFLMNFEWGTSETGALVGSNIPAARLTKSDTVVEQDPATGEERRRTVEVPITYEDLPEARGVSQALNDRGRQLMIEGNCLACHTLGDYGGFIGPNLTVAGDWNSPEFLRMWLTDPAATIPRMPTVWMGDGVRKTTPEDIPVDWTGIHLTRMPAPTSLGVPEDELEVLVQYLSGLRSE